MVYRAGRGPRRSRRVGGGGKVRWPWWAVWRPARVSAETLPRWTSRR
jgi:hypothetical protein